MITVLATVSFLELLGSYLSPGCLSPHLSPLHCPGLKGGISACSQPPPAARFGLSWGQDLRKGARDGLYRVRPSFPRPGNGEAVELSVMGLGGAGSPGASYYLQRGDGSCGRASPHPEVCFWGMSTPQAFTASN